MWADSLGSVPPFRPQPTDPKSLRCRLESRWAVPDTGPYRHHRLPLPPYPARLFPIRICYNPRR